jgi:hypothetical protein
MHECESKIQKPYPSPSTFLRIYSSDMHRDDYRSQVHRYPCATLCAIRTTALIKSKKKSIIILPV